MTSQEVEQYADTILGSARVRNKYVFLCEGDLSDIFQNERLSPSSLRQLSKLPDSSFYTACLNKDIQKYKRPEFFNCGGRSDVIKVFNKIQEKASVGEKEYFLNIERLYVILDLDLQIGNINNDLSTEDIYKYLYDNTKIVSSNINNNKIFVTGLIHKEAYFLLPKFEEIFKKYKNPLEYNDTPIQLSSIYHDIISGIEEDTDLINNLQTAIDRMPSGINTLEKIKSLFTSQLDEYSVKLLFTIRKVKPYFGKITTKDELTDERLREQLEIDIANKISENDDPNCHITAIFNTVIV